MLASRLSSEFVVFRPTQKIKETDLHGMYICIHSSHMNKSYLLYMLMVTLSI